MASPDLSEDIIQSQLIATVLGGNEAPSESSGDGSIFEALKNGLVAARIPADEAETLIMQCLSGVEAAKQNGVAARASKDSNQW